jgi:hypothetical protein
LIRANVYEEQGETKTRPTAHAPDFLKYCRKYGVPRLKTKD